MLKVALGNNMHVMRSQTFLELSLKFGSEHPSSQGEKGNQRVVLFAKAMGKHRHMPAHTCVSVHQGRCD